MKISLSVIIVSFKNIGILRDCLDSVEKFNDIGDGLEVIVSDNSPDNTLYDTIGSEYEWVQIIKNENIGFGAGNNRGYEISSGEVLLFLNPDTVLVEPVFGFALEKFDSDKNLAMFGVQLIDRNYENNDSFFIMDKYGIFSTMRSHYARRTGKYRDGKMFLCGANLFVRRSSFEQAGRFDENIFMYKEEADLIKRIKLHSSAKKTAFFKDKRIIHLEGGTEDADSSKAITQLSRLTEADRYYAEKWNLSYLKILKQRRRFHRFKLFVLRCLFKRKRAVDTKKIINFLNSKIEDAKRKNG